jgi:hypothetical protein
VGQFISQLDREFVRQFVDQHSGFYSWSTFSSSPSVSDDIGVLFENGRRQRERLYKSLKLIVMKLIASKCNFLCKKCAKTHLRAFVASKNFPGAKPPDPQHYREGGKGKGSEGKEKGRKERDGREGEGRGGEGRGGEGRGGEGREGEREEGEGKGGEKREGKGREGGEGGEREKSTPPPPANPRSATVNDIQFSVS